MGLILVSFSALERIDGIVELKPSASSPSRT